MARAAASKPAPYPVNRPERSLKESDLAKKRGMQVRMMASTKASLTAIASMFDMSVDELKKQHGADLDHGPDYVYAAVSLRLVNAAMGGDMRAMLAWLRQFGGWQEVTRKELTGKNGEPITIRNLDDHALAAVVRSLSEGDAIGRGAGRNGTSIDLDGATYLDAVSGPTGEGAQ